MFIISKDNIEANTMLDIMVIRQGLNWYLLNVLGYIQGKTKNDDNKIYMKHKGQLLKPKSSVIIPMTHTLWNISSCKL